MLRVFILFLFSLFILPTTQSVAQRSINEENLGYISLADEIFSDVGGLNTFRLILSLKEVAQIDKDMNLIFKAAGVDKEKALTAFKCFGIVTDLVGAGIKRTNAVRITREAEADGADISSAANVLTHALKKEGVLIDSTQASEALRQAKLLLDIKLNLNPKVAFEENGINIDLINIVHQARKRSTNQWGTRIGEKSLLPRTKK